MNTISRRKRDHQWSSLPKDLLTTIADRLGTHIDVLRLRAVCPSWRSSIPLFTDNSPRFPIKVPHPKSVPFINTCLTERTLYRLEPLHLHEEEDDINISNNSASSKKNGWLVKVEEWKLGHFTVLNPLSHQKIRYNDNKPETFPKKLNLLDYRVFELSKSYCLEYLTPGLSPDKAIYSVDDSAILVMYDGGKLAFLRLGDDYKWTQLYEGRSAYYTDIMLYEGKFHAIDNRGQVVVIDSSTLKMSKVWRRLHTNGRLKKFLQNSGDLYIIAQNAGRFSDTNGIVLSDDVDDYSEYDNSAFFQIYKLSEAGWVVAKSLEDRVAFLGEDCSFLASAEQLSGCKGNCMYFSHNHLMFYRIKDNDNGYNTRLFNLVDHSLTLLSTGPANFQVFWPPPTWLREAKY